MTSPVSAVEVIEWAMEGVKHSEWFMSPWHIEEDASSVRNQSDRSYICNASSDSFAAYIAACNPVAMREVLALARQAEALQRENAKLREALRKVEERASGGTVVFGQSQEMTAARVRYLEKDIQDIVYKALLGGSDAGN